MSKTYVIRWKSKVNGRAGRGSKLFEREEAERLVAELNQEYPEIEHELVNTEGEPRPSGPRATGPDRSPHREPGQAPPNPSHAFSE